jgi:putative ABC transport system permease protein
VIDLLREGWEGIRAHRVRSFLSTLGILFGVAAVIGILSIGEGARREAETLIDRLGTRNFQLKARDFEKDQQLAEDVARKSQGLSLRDRSALEEELPEIEGVGALRVLKVREIVPRPKDLGQVRVVGADPAYLSAVHLARVAGRALTLDDERTRSPVCLLGREARRVLFGDQAVIGRPVRIEGTWLTVVGVFEEAGRGGSTSVKGLDLDDRSRDVVMPLATLLGRFPHDAKEAELSEVIVAVRSRDEVLGTSALARRIVDRLHRDQPDYQIVIPLKILEQSRAQQRIFNLVMGLIAGISLLVGGIGIMNITLASVMERTREIGVRMAVGAAPRDILMLFLVEASLISGMGGLMGIVAGMLIAWLVGLFTGWTTAVDLPAVGIATLLSMAEGVIFGILPAREAAKLPPAIAVKA